MHPIHQAASAGDLPALKHLLDRGTPVDLHDPDTGHTPLMTACLSARAGIDVLEFLLAAGADIHAPVQPAPVESPDTDSLLDDPDLDPDIRALLEQSRSFCETEPDDRPLIALAVADASLDKIRFLLDHGAKPHFQSRAGYSLLTLAACARRDDVIDLLLERGAPLDAVSSYGESALSVLSREGRFGEVRKLLDHGADPAPLKWTPLMQAVVFGSTDEVAALLDGGAELEADDAWSRTPFLLAVCAGRIDRAALLLEGGADWSATGRCQSPPLSYPTARDDAPMMRWLIARGFDVNQADEFGNTPLMDAVSNGAIECVRILLDAGADPDRTDHIGEALMPKASDPRVIELLLGHRSTAEAHRHETPVYRLHITSGEIERVSVTGPSPGWIHSHQAEHIHGRIVISGGKIVRRLDDGETELIDHAARYALDLQVGTWHPLD